jgi:hypothetical protein
MFIVVSLVPAVSLAKRLQTIPLENVKVAVSSSWIVITNGLTEHLSLINMGLSTMQSSGRLAEKKQN